MGMSRYRNIHCLIWNDDKFPFASDECQLVFFHLITTPFSSPFGLYKASIEALAAEKRWPVKAYREAFAEAFEKGFVKYDERTQVILLPHFLKYNPPGNPNVLKSWGKQFQEIPASPLKSEFYEELKAFTKVMGKAFLKAFEEGFAKPLPIQEQEQEHKTGTDPLCGGRFSQPPHAQDEEDLEEEYTGPENPHPENSQNGQSSDRVMAYTFSPYRAAEDFSPSPAVLALAAKDAPHVNLERALKRFKTFTFKQAVLDWDDRFYRFVLEDEDRHSTRQKPQNPQGMTDREYRSVQNGVELAEEIRNGTTGYRPILRLAQRNGRDV